MPNGHPYFLRSSEDYCQRCGEPLCDHDRERVYNDNPRAPPGAYRYEYLCKPSGLPAKIPSGRTG